MDLENVVDGAEAEEKKRMANLMASRSGGGSITREKSERFLLITNCTHIGNSFIFV